MTKKRWKNEKEKSGGIETKLSEIEEVNNV
jgi:hypothetical protein